MLRINRSHIFLFVFLSLISQVNGYPSCANSWLLTDVVRGYWGRPDATTVSDCGAVENMAEQNHFASNYSTATADSLHAGTDWCIGTAFLVKNGLADAYSEGRIGDSDLDAALTRLMTVRFRLGMFDPPESQVYTSYGSEKINNAAAREAAYQGTAQGMVLLKNENSVLPIDLWSPSIKSIAVVGPHAVSQRVSEQVWGLWRPRYEQALSNDIDAYVILSR